MTKNTGCTIHCFFYVADSWKDWNKTFSSDGGGAQLKKFKKETPLTL